MAKMGKDTVKGKRKYNSTDEAVMQEALTEVTQDRLSLNKAAKVFGIPKSTLNARLRNVRKELADSQEEPSIMGLRGLKNKKKVNKFASGQTFTVLQEEKLVDYLLDASKLNFGITLMETRELAYNWAIDIGHKVPESWEINKKAGKTWATWFLKRHRCQISLRKPEATSMARNNSFTRDNVEIFLNNLQKLMEQHHFEPSRIFNLDETGLSTVLQPPKVVASTKAKQVGKCVTAERGETITICAFVSAAGEAFPPVYLFPRKRNHPEYMLGCFEGSVAFFNEKGYMDTATFLKTLEHFKAQTAASKDNQALLILDNHVSHLSVDALKYCKANGIHMLTLPPHTSHRTQPLDLAVFGPFKSYCARAYDSWISARSGNRVTLHNIAGLSLEPLRKCMTSKNIKAGFMKSGIYPMDSSKLLAFFEPPEAASDARTEFDPEALLTSPLPRAMNSTPISQEATAQVIITNETMLPFLPLNIQQTSAQEINLREATFHENVSHEIVSQDPSSLEIIAHEATFLENVSQKSQIEEIRLQDIVEESTIHDNFFIEQSLISSDDQALDLTVSTRELQEDNRGMMVQKTCPIPNIPLDLSVNSNTHSKPHAFQLRYGGLEIVRPLPSPPKTNKKKQGMVSTIATSSPELKKKEDMQMKKRVKDKVKEENKRIKEEKKNQGRSTPKTAKRKILPDTEVQIPQKKKRGRPRKVPSLSEV